MNHCVLAFVTLSILSATSGVAMADPAASSATASTEPSTSQPDPNAIVCRTGAPVTGTRLGPKRECHPQWVWDERRLQAMTILNDIQAHGVQKSIPGQ